MRYSRITKWFNRLMSLFDLKQRENEVWNHTHTQHTHTLILIDSFTSR